MLENSVKFKKKSLTWTTLVSREEQKKQNEETAYTLSISISFRPSCHEQHSEAPVWSTAGACYQGNGASEEAACYVNQDDSQGVQSIYTTATLSSKACHCVYTNSGHLNSTCFIWLNAKTADGSKH